MDQFLTFKNFLFSKKHEKVKKGLTAVITGGSGRIGSIFTNQLLLNGHHVISLSRDKNQFDKFKKNLPVKFQKKLTWCFVDLSIPETIEKTVKIIKTKFKNIDILINNGSQNLRGESVNYDKKMIYSEFWGGFGGTFLLTEKFLPFLRTSKNAKIINVCSIWGMNASKSSTYLNLDIGPSQMLGSNKASLIQYTKQLATREIKNKITVNGLIPGWFPRKGKKENAKYIKSICQNIPANRIGKLKDLISSVDFLTSYKSTYYTGQFIIVDGGYTLW
jgi:NAD(P)-dependent dehydrogenase (short-subunit alcohol dehydrogenase family)